jgi:hypothetical protein
MNKNNASTSKPKNRTETPPFVIGQTQSTPVGGTSKNVKNVPKRRRISARRTRNTRGNGSTVGGNAGTSKNTKKNQNTKPTSTPVPVPFGTWYMTVKPPPVFGQTNSTPAARAPANNAKKTTKNNARNAKKPNNVGNATTAPQRNGQGTSENQENTNKLILNILNYGNMVQRQVPNENSPNTAKTPNTQPLRRQISAFNDDDIEYRPQTAVSAAEAGMSADIVDKLHELDLERETVRQHMMHDDAGKNTVDIMRFREHQILVDSYLDQIMRYIDNKDADGVARTIQKYQTDRRNLFLRHRAMNLEFKHREKFGDLLLSGNSNRIKAFIKSDKRRKIINSISPDITALVENGKHDQALKLWEKKMKAVENESNTKSFRAKNAIKNGTGFGSAFKVKFRMPSFEKPEGQWVKRRH